MCGIAGYSLRPESRINARELAHNLLAAIEWRGGMASGIAYADLDKGHTVYAKEAVTGSNLGLKGMPRNTKTAILHTRLATHGAVEDNRNNHPVLSPDEMITLVHNGVIWNHDTLRQSSLREFDLPDVDSSVLPALLQKYGTDGMEEIAGDAAISWLVSGEGNKLHLARIESSPVAYTNLVDGSFVFASTGELLDEALEKSNLRHGAIRLMHELEYYMVVDGVIMNLEYLPKPQGFGYGWASSFRGATSGGHKRGFSDAALGLPRQKGSENTPRVGSTFLAGSDGQLVKMDDGTWLDEDEYYEREDAEFDAAMALTDAYDKLEGPQGDLAMTGDRFFTVSHDGDYVTYKTLDHLETTLCWFAGLSVGDNPHYSAEGNARWVEHFVDIGAIAIDGTETSWVDDPSEVWQFEDPQSDGLEYIREGVGYLKAEIGA